MSLHRTDSHQGSYIIIVDGDEHEAHAGRAFHYSEGFALNNTGVQTFLFTVPTTALDVHCHFGVGTSGAALITLDEAGDRVGTSAKTSFNKNRRSSNAPICTIHKGTSSGSTDGTEIAGAAVGASGGMGPFRFGSGGSSAHEFLLKSNTKYLLTITSQADNNNVTVSFNWVESTYDN